MNRPQQRRSNPSHPHNEMLDRRWQRRRARQTSHPVSPVDIKPPQTREEYEAVQATLPVEDRVPW